MNIPMQMLPGLDRETFGTLLGAADSYLEDLDSGLADGTYDDDHEQKPLREAVERGNALHANWPTASVIAEQSTSAKVWELLSDMLDFQDLSIEAHDSLHSALEEWQARATALIAEQNGDPS